MAFEKKVWADRIAEYINRRLLTKEDGTTELVTVARNEGTVSQEGDAFNAENMNDLEERIAAEFDSQNEALTQLNSSLVCNVTQSIGEEYATVNAHLAKNGNMAELTGAVTINKTFSVESGVFTFDRNVVPSAYSNYKSWVAIVGVGTNGLMYPFFIKDNALYSVTGVTYPSGILIVFNSHWHC